MKKIIFILILISLYGCGLQRRTYCERKANKVARILKDCPNLIDTITVRDTVIVRDSFTTVIHRAIDSTGIDSLLALYCNAINTVDTVEKAGKSEIIRQYIFKECEKINDGKYFLKDQKGDTVTVVIKGRTMTAFTSSKVITIKEHIVVPCPDCKMGIKQVFLDWWLLLLIIFVVGFFAGIYRK